MPHYRIRVSFFIFFGCLSRKQDIFVQWYGYFFFKYWTSEFLCNFIQLPTALFCQYLCQIISAVLTPAGMVML